MSLVIRNLLCLHGEGVGSGVIGVPGASWSGEFVGGSSWIAVAVAAEGEERSQLRESIGSGEEDVGVVDGRDMDGVSMGVCDGVGGGAIDGGSDVGDVGGGIGSADIGDVDLE